MINLSTLAIVLISLKIPIVSLPRLSVKKLDIWHNNLQLIWYFIFQLTRHFISVKDPQSDIIIRFINIVYLAFSNCQLYSYDYTPPLILVICNSLIFISVLQAYFYYDVQYPFIIFDDEKKNIPTIFNRKNDYNFKV